MVVQHRVLVAVAVNVVVVGEAHVHASKTGVVGALAEERDQLLGRDNGDCERLHALVRTSEDLLALHQHFVSRERH